MLFIKQYLYYFIALGVALILAAFAYSYYYAYNQGVGSGKAACQLEVAAAVAKFRTEQDLVVKNESKEVVTVYLPGKTKYITQRVETEKAIAKEITKHPEITTHACFSNDSTFKLLNAAIITPSEGSAVPGSPP